VDRDALAEQLPAHRAGLLAQVRSTIRDPVLAEDVVSESMVRALERAESLREPAALRAWLHRIAERCTVDALRDVREEPRDDVGEMVEARWRQDAFTVDAEAVVQRAADREELLDALARLPAPIRSVLLLHDSEGWTSREIAAEFGLGVPAVKQRLRRGRMRLVSALATGYERRAALHGIPLNCWDARQLVSAYLDGELPPPRAAMVERHLATCPTCPPLVASVVAATEHVGRLGPLRDRDDVVDPRTAEAIRRRRARA
jgi:RNA polymerase sigma-70 factor (ECF subfamily)